MSFSPHAQPSAPLWIKEVGGGAGLGGARSAPCGEPSPTSSEESCSAGSGTEGAERAEGSGYRRLGGGPAPLMRRLARLARLPPDDDDSTPLVPDTPTSPVNHLPCLPTSGAGGYINEASEAELRTRRFDRDLPADVDVDFRHCNIVNNGGGGSGGGSASSGGTSSSGSWSGVAGCGAGCGATRNNNPRAEPELRQAAWFQQGIPREIALEVLSAQPVGAFLVRASTTQPAAHALSVRVPTHFSRAGIAHYLILRTPKGYKIKGFTKEFSSLSALVTHHSVMPELLPVPLRLARAPPAARRRRDHADLESVAPSPHHTPRHTPHSTPHHVHSFLTRLDV